VIDAFRENAMTEHADALYRAGYEVLTPLDNA
jgi:hypothetical protein